MIFCYTRWTANSSLQSLFQAYLQLAGASEKKSHYDRSAGCYILTARDILPTLQRYFIDVSFDAAQVPSYRPELDAIVMPSLDGFGANGGRVGNINTSTSAGVSNTFGLDCSGYGSKCWGLSSHYGTGQLGQVSQEISWSALQKGDALLKLARM